MPHRSSLFPRALLKSPPPVSVLPLPADSAFVRRFPCFLAGATACLGTPLSCFRDSGPCGPDFIVSASDSAGTREHLPAPPSLLSTLSRSFLQITSQSQPTQANAPPKAPPSSMQAAWLDPTPPSPPSSSNQMMPWTSLSLSDAITLPVSPYSDSWTSQRGVF